MLEEMRAERNAWREQAQRLALAAPAPPPGGPNVAAGYRARAGGGGTGAIGCCFARVTASMSTVQGATAAHTSGRPLHAFVPMHVEVQTN
jgi:hypothetical protein